jgi:hypothetical protein
MRFQKGLWAAGFAFGMVFMAGSARADFTGVGIWVNNTCASTATQAEYSSCFGSKSGMVTFTTSALDFNSNGTSNYSIGNFLTGGGATITNVIYTGSGIGSATHMDAAGGMLFEFTGTASFSNGTLYSVAHDDGVTFVVNGTEVLGGAGNVGGTAENCSAGTNFGSCIDGPTSAVTTNYTFGLPSGNYAFNFAYGECCSAPAVFQTTLAQNATTVPEPTSILLLGGVLLAVGRGLRRKLA